MYLNGAHRLVDNLRNHELLVGRRPRRDVRERRDDDERRQKTSDCIVRHIDGVGAGVVRSVRSPKGCVANSRCGKLRRTYKYVAPFYGRAAQGGGRAPDPAAPFHLVISRTPLALIHARCALSALYRTWVVRYVLLEDCSQFETVLKSVVFSDKLSTRLE